MRYPSTRLLLASALLLAACDGAEPPLAPAEEPGITGTRSGEVTAALTAWPRIAFASYRDGNNDIYVMDPQGYQVTRLTSVADRPGHAGPDDPPLRGLWRSPP